MGNHVAGNAIGKLAQAAFEQRPHGQTALQILDKICEPHRGCDAEFESEDPNTPGNVHPDFASWRDPNPGAGLGMLMLEAFAPNGAKDLARFAPGFDDRDDIRAYDAWRSEVCDPFNARYDFC